MRQTALTEINQKIARTKYFKHQTVESFTKNKQSNKSKKYFFLLHSVVEKCTRVHKVKKSKVYTKVLIL